MRSAADAASSLMSHITAVMNDEEEDQQLSRFKRTRKGTTVTIKRKSERSEKMLRIIESSDFRKEVIG